jgi:hypothetical protein
MTGDEYGEVQAITNRLIVRPVAHGLFEMTGIDDAGVQSWICDVAYLQGLVDLLVEDLRRGPAEG